MLPSFSWTTHIFLRFAFLWQHADDHNDLGPWGAADESHARTCLWGWPTVMTSAPHGIGAQRTGEDSQGLEDSGDVPEEAGHRWTHVEQEGGGKAGTRPGSGA